VIAVAILITATGCGRPGGDAIATDAGPPAAARTAVQDTVRTEEWRPWCDEPTPGGNSPRFLAVQEIERVGREVPDRYAGHRRCDGPRRIVVFRIPDAGFDETVRTIAARYGVVLRLRPAPVALSDWRSIRERAYARNPVLRLFGASVETTFFKPEGHIRIGIHGDMTAARRILKDLEDLPYVELVPSAPVRSV
jgi:hypothetical protein